MLIDILPWLISMALLTAASAFFSASEAAYFSLRAADRSRLESGGRGQRIAAQLLSNPERLLTAVLFWNLVVNIAYFAIVSITAIHLEEDLHVRPTVAVGFAFGALVSLIFFSEMLPKSVAVLIARSLAGLMSVPLAIAVRAADPLMPVLRGVNLLSRRLLWPRFKPEPYLDVFDLERAIEMSTTDAELIEQERLVLQNIVMLSDIRADEWMRPRSQFVSYRPPVSLAALEGRMTPSGYLLVTEPDSEEVAGAVNLRSLAEMPNEHLEHKAEPVVYAPWCTTVASVLEQMRTRDREVAAIVNEFGETVGILTFDDLLDTIFTYHPSRSKRLMDRNPIHYVSDGLWLVAGVTGLRRLERYLKIELPPSKSSTVGGVIQESLQRLAAVGDQCDWGPFHFRVLEVPERGHMLIELTWAKPQEETE